MKKIFKDYCSFAPDWIMNYDLRGCCYIHDEMYNASLPNKKKKYNRAEADLYFKK